MCNKFDSRQRYPKRNVSKVCYAEEDTSSDEDYIDCEDYDYLNDVTCPTYGSPISISNKEVSPSPSFAWNACPEFLYISITRTKGPGLGIWAKNDLISGLVFGPYKGKITKEAQSSGYAWNIHENGKVSHCIEGSDTSVSSWMIFVNCATCEECQNLVAFQYRGEIFYRTNKLVKACNELLVWFGNDYGEELGIHLSAEEVRHDGETTKADNASSNMLSSSIIRKCSSMPNQPPSEICSERKDNQVSVKPGFHNRAIRGILADFDINEKNDVEKRIEMDSVGKENISLADKDKCINSPDTINIISKFNKGPTYDHRALDIGNLQDFTGALHEKKIMYRCQVCHYRTKRACDLRQHVYEVHDRSKHNMPEKWDYRSSRVRDFPIHTDAIYEGNKPHKCPYSDFRKCHAPVLQSSHNFSRCDDRTRHSFVLKNYVDDVEEHDEENCENECYGCDCRTCDTLMLRNHLDAVHERKTLHKYPHCGYRLCHTFAHQSHDVKRPHKCTHCDYKTCQVGNLLQHIYAVHKGMKLYECIRCEFKTSWPGELRRHTKLVHRGDV